MIEAHEGNCLKCLAETARAEQIDGSFLSELSPVDMQRGGLDYVWHEIEKQPMPAVERPSRDAPSGLFPVLYRFIRGGF